jgi:2-amino-4-hydroxy-6-hydroxymethyldihydropteridine diphosphokinase
MLSGPLNPSQAAAAGSLAVALGANLGDPLATLLAVRPLLAELLLGWWKAPQAAGPSAGLAWPRPRLRWSPLFRTAPVGGPADQPPYLNAVVVVDGGPAQTPADQPQLQGPPARQPQAQELLQSLLALERRFGRVRSERWGPRSLDLDLLWCGPDPLDRPGLSLPHPRLRERAFVLTPLAAIDPALLVPGDAVVAAARVRALLEGLPPQALEPPPQRLRGLAGWPEA